MVKRWRQEWENENGHSEGMEGLPWDKMAIEIEEKQEAKVYENFKEKELFNSTQ